MRRWNAGRFLAGAIPAALFLSFQGCAVKARTRAAPPPETVSKREKLVAHLEGTWEAGGQARPRQDAVFDRDGTVMFRNGLAQYSPATWTLHADQNELALTFPSATLEDMQIFQMYVGRGVTSFLPHERQATYRFTADTWMLNIAGWEYAKRDETVAEIQEEPLLK